MTKQLNKSKPGTQQLFSTHVMSIGMNEFIKECAYLTLAILHRPLPQKVMFRLPYQEKKINLKYEKK